MVIPFRNEAPRIDRVVKGIPDFVDLIIAVDDSSTDGGLNSCYPRLTKIRNASRLGVGGAIMRGHILAKNMGSDVDVVMAGDGQMDPAYLPKLLDAIDSGCDYAKGNRFLKRGDKEGMPSKRIVGNRILAFFTKLASGYWHISDPQNGYTALRTSTLDKMEIEHIWRGYQFENDMLVHLNLVGAKIRDVPIPAKYESPKSGIRLSSFVPFTLLFLLQRTLWRLWRVSR